VWRHFAAFGIGSMIYSGLEFGQYFEVERDTKCHNVLLALTPATRMAFTFIQMYFIFLNNEVRASNRLLLNLALAAYTERWCKPISYNTYFALTYN
jgi:hypothetical protein